MEKSLPPIPAKRYFTIGEVSELCGVKPYVLRYWEQEFTQLKPMKRRGNRRYYQHHEVLLIRRIRELLYEQGFTISGARNRLADAGAHRANAIAAQAQADATHAEPAMPPRHDRRVTDGAVPEDIEAESPLAPLFTLSAAQVRQELLSIRGLLAP
jgi:DNA-binding transcriptional MerR regulator